MLEDPTEYDCRPRASRLLHSKAANAVAYLITVLTIAGLTLFSVCREIAIWS